jgi:hypothetical protein
MKLRIRKTIGELNQKIPSDLGLVPEERPSLKKAG